MNKLTPNVVIYKGEHRGVGGTNFNFTQQGNSSVIYRVSIAFKIFEQDSTSIWEGNASEQRKKLAEFNDHKYVMPKEAFERIGFVIQLAENDCHESGIPKNVCWFCEVVEPGRLATEKYKNGVGHGGDVVTKS